jgi:hypothetical protein
MGLPGWMLNQLNLLLFTPTQKMPTRQFRAIVAHRMASGFGHLCGYIPHSLFYPRLYPFFVIFVVLGLLKNG